MFFRKILNCLPFHLSVLYRFFRWGGQFPLIKRMSYFCIESSSKHYDNRLNSIQIGSGRAIVFSGRTISERTIDHLPRYDDFHEKLIFNFHHFSHSIHHRFTNTIGWSAPSVPIISAEFCNENNLLKFQLDSLFGLFRWLLMSNWIDCERNSLIPQIIDPWNNAPQTIHSS